MAKREFLMLAQNFRPNRDFPVGCYLSEKLDGIRCWWDGGVSRDIPCFEIPWANVAKHLRFVRQIRATGLWTRYGQPIQAPGWWLDKLPKTSLDGELWAGRGEWQLTSSITRTQQPDNVDWHKIKYMVFDAPHPNIVLADGRINNTNFKKVFKDCWNWYKSRITSDMILGRSFPFFEALEFLKSVINSSVCFLHEQILLTTSLDHATHVINEKMQEVTRAGGEGLMLRKSTSFWEPERVWHLLKIKSFQDAEGTVVGYTWAKPTDLDRSLTGQTTNKLLGLMGSIKVQFGEVVFDLSGFTDLERELVDPFKKDFDIVSYGKDHAGEAVPDWIHNPKFPRNSKIRFKYRELSDSGIPKEARFFR